LLEFLRIGQACLFFVVFCVVAMHAKRATDSLTDWIFCDGRKSEVDEARKDEVPSTHMETASVPSLPPPTTAPQHTGNALASWSSSMLQMMLSPLEGRSEAPTKHPAETQPGPPADDKDPGNKNRRQPTPSPSCYTWRWSCKIIGVCLLLAYLNYDYYSTEDYITGEWIGRTAFVPHPPRLFLGPPAWEQYEIVHGYSQKQRPPPGE
jgi:hypothetical protein